MDSWNTRAVAIPAGTAVTRNVNDRLFLRDNHEARPVAQQQAALLVFQLLIRLSRFFIEAKSIAA